MRVGRGAKIVAAQRFETTAHVVAEFIVASEAPLYDLARLLIRAGDDIQTLAVRRSSAPAGPTLTVRSSPAQPGPPSLFVKYAHARGGGVGDLGGRREPRRSSRGGMKKIRDSRRDRSRGRIFMGLATPNFGKNFGDAWPHRTPSLYS
jgi:hypothetical protein